MIKNNYLIILCGLPASGKSFFAKKFRSILENKKSEFTVKIVDPDIIRNNLYSGEFNHNKESIVREKNLNEIREALENNMIVISDDLNYYTSMRHDLKELAEKLNINYYIIHISTPVEQCIIWNESRGQTIPSEIILNIHNKFDPFNNYTWDNPIAEFDISKVVNLDKEIKTLIKMIENDIRISLEKSNQKQSQKSTNRYNEMLDQITRKIVNHMLKKIKKNSHKTQIINLRKIFIKKNLKKKSSNSEIRKSFKLFLDEHLKEEKSNSLPKNSFKK
jgi:tRNA uridine 5-carbamoylmethylation protein Kti12